MKKMTGIVLFALSGLALIAAAAAGINSNWSQHLSGDFEVPIRRSEERRVGKECRSLCDWSSDVCSSDLRPLRAQRARAHRRGSGRNQQQLEPAPVRRLRGADPRYARAGPGDLPPEL